MKENKASELLKLIMCEGNLESLNKDDKPEIKPLPMAFGCDMSK